MEEVKTDSLEKKVFVFRDAENQKSIVSKEVFKNLDKIVVFPFYQDKFSSEFKQKYKNLKSFTFENLGGIFPNGFRQTPKYGVTTHLRPLIKFIDSNLGVENLTISKNQESHLEKNSLILNYKDVTQLWKSIGFVLRKSKEKNQIIVNNYFSIVLPKLFSSAKADYEKGIISHLSLYKNIGRNISVEDKRVLINIFDEISLSKKNSVVEKNYLISTREKIEEKFIEDAIVEFDKNFKVKRRFKEENWQIFFKENGWIFSQIFYYPTVLYKDKAYIGGKTISDSDGKIVDFLYRNNLTKNSALIEIKTHTSKLLTSRPYRESDIYGLDKELSGAISQVLNQKHTYIREFENTSKKHDIEAFNPKCVVIIGKLSDLNSDQIKSFELIRSSMKDVDILTFDEIHERIKSMLNLLTKKKK